uniref:Uncharacterized protein n=1 Tax=Aegilops tauschii subsp. strangulata TaxID=200361 RepID=A0A452Y1L8_AEGTS
QGRRTARTDAATTMRTSLHIAMVAAVVLLLAVTATAHVRMDLMDGYRPQQRRGGGGGSWSFDFMKGLWGG